MITIREAVRLYGLAGFFSVTRLLHEQLQTHCEPLSREPAAPPAAPELLPLIRNKQSLIEEARTRHEQQYNEQAAFEQTLRTQAQESEGFGRPRLRLSDSARASFLAQLSRTNR